MTRMGPNDARRVVWAIGVFFYISFVFFFTLTNILQYIHDVCDREDGDDENGPKRCQTRRLGHRCVFFNFFCVFFYTN